ncbi:MAG: ABC transporter permease [Oligoflexia bacterium]|nr:ABC transporter permease [Oligoflexia bacterium]
MAIFVLRRLLSAIPTLLLLATLTFFLLRLAPGGPFDGDRAWPPEIMANIQARYGLDQPLPAQFARWLGDVSRGDLRESFQYIGRPVSEIISESLPVSLMLGSWAMLFAVALGIPLGCLAAWKRNTWLDHSAMFLAIAGVSLPSYLVASVLILVFALWLGWVPPALWEEPGSAILPVLTLGSRPLAIIARLTRASMLEALSGDYIRTAYGKGLPDSRVIFKHALKNSVIPVITVIGPLAANLVTGSFLVEIVFQLPGMGKHFVQAVLNRDYPLVMGVTLVYGVILILSNLLVDLTYAWADPRIRLES